MFDSEKIIRSARLMRFLAATVTSAGVLIALGVPAPGARADDAVAASPRVAWLAESTGTALSATPRPVFPALLATEEFDAYCSSYLYALLVVTADGIRRVKLSGTSSGWSAWLAVGGRRVAYLDRTGRVRTVTVELSGRVTKRRELRALGVTDQAWLSRDGTQIVGTSGSRVVRIDLASGRRSVRRLARSPYEVERVEFAAGLDAAIVVTTAEWLGAETVWFVPARGRIRMLDRAVNPGGRTSIAVLGGGRLIAWNARRRVGAPTRLGFASGNGWVWHRTVTSLGHHVELTPRAWSPDGSALAFDWKRTRGPAASGAALVTAGGALIRDLPRLAVDGWSPDGARLLLHSRRDGQGLTRVVGVGVNGRTERDVHAAIPDDDPPSTSFAWLAGHHRVAFSSDASVGLLDLDSGRRRVLARISGIVGVSAAVGVAPRAGAHAADC